MSEQRGPERRHLQILGVLVRTGGFPIVADANQLHENVLRRNPAVYFSSMVKSTLVLPLTLASLLTPGASRCVFT